MVSARRTSPSARAPGQLLGSGTRRSSVSAPQGRGDKSGKERVRPGGTRLQLGMELAANEPGVVRQLDYLDQAAIRRLTREPQAIFREHVTIGITDLPPVPVTLADLCCPVNLCR